MSSSLEYSGLGFLVAAKVISVTPDTVTMESTTHPGLRGIGVNDVCGFDKILSQLDASHKPMCPYVIDDYIELFGRPLCKDHTK